jgi:hypothetical protein
MPSKPSPFKKVSLTTQNRTMAYYYSQIAQQQQLLTRVKAVLPYSIACQIRYCLIKEKKLLLYTDSATWASQIRFYNKAILLAIASLCKTPPETIQVKVLIQTIGGSLGSIRKANLPSNDKIALIRHDSLAIPDLQLREALLKLSTTLDRLSNSN